MVTSYDAIQKMLSYMHDHADIGLLGPRLLYINGEHQPSCFRFYSPRTILARRTPFGKTPWGKRELDRFLLKPPPRARRQLTGLWVRRSLCVEKRIMQLVRWMKDTSCILRIQTGVGVFGRRDGKLFIIPKHFSTTTTSGQAKAQTR